MTGLTLPASTAAALPGKVAAPSLLALGAPGDAAGVPSLAAFVDLMAGKTDVTGMPGGGDGERQDDAAPGNALPDKAEAPGKDGSDPALAWLLSVPPIALPPVVPTGSAASGAPASDPAISAAGNGTADKAPMAALPPALSLAPPVAGDALQPAADPRAVSAVEVAPAAPVPAASPAVAVDGATATAALVSAAGPAPATLAATGPILAPPAATVPQTADAKPAKATDSSVAPAQAAAQPIRIALAQAAPAAPALAAAAANKPMPALFALAMAPDRERSAEPEKDNAGGAAIVAATLLSPTDAAALVAQPGEAQRQALDMGRQDWPQKMIDRIEALRDDANANDTSIRLKPEALGRVDVALRTHADGAVSVHFTAEQPATRTLIADAAPQLNAAAEARGIRLAGTSVDLSGSGMADGNRPRPQFAAPQNKANPVSAARGDDIQAVADGRIA